MSKRMVHSLKWQMFCAALISVLVAGMVFAIAIVLGGTVLNRTVYGRSFAKEMANQKIVSLQEYIDGESVSLEGLQRLNAWFGRGDKVYLTIYEGNRLIYESPLYGEPQTELSTNEYSPDLENAENEYILTFDGGVKVRSFLYYYAGDTFYFWMMTLAGFVAFLAFSLCFMVLINRKIAYISLLKRELDILSGGQLEYAVTIHGKDELGDLALGIDQMRQSIIKHQEIENQMRSANSELITAMSHDLRTPLTSLLAYLEIVERKKYSSEEQMHMLIQKSVGQTMRIKNMADKLFEYFLAYATEWECSELETADADLLFYQIAEEYAYALESKGMLVEKDCSTVDAKVKVNIGLLQRALDNLYSNLLKYADPSKPILIAYKKEGKRFLLTISNGIKADHKKSESTSIGLITCRRIIQYHGGEFKVVEDENTFFAMVSIPLHE